MPTVSNTSAILNLAIIGQLRLDKRIPSLREAMAELREKAGFRIGDDLLAEILGNGE